MKVIESNLANQIVERRSLSIGELFFFNDIVISEINEGVHVTFENAQELIEEIKNYFGTSKPFGLISNMANSYSMNLTDASKFRIELSNISAYVMVAYNAAGKLNAQLASDVCGAQDITFQDLCEAANWVSAKTKALINNL